MCVRERLLVCEHTNTIKCTHTHTQHTHEHPATHTHVQQCIGTHARVHTYTRTHAHTGIYILTSEEDQAEHEANEAAAKDKELAAIARGSRSCCWYITSCVLCVIDYACIIYFLGEGATAAAAGTCWCMVLYREKDEVCSKRQVFAG